MITINEYIEWYKKEKREMLDSGHFRSEPKFLFKRLYDDTDEWIFNPDNWNGGDILRHGLLDILDHDKTDGLPEIKYFRHDDQTTFLVFVKADWYEISWYKSRGRTDHIKKNGEPINLEDYIELCNLLNLPLK
jgi:hypothetical protein